MSAQREIITFYGVTTSGATSGIITLNSDLLYTSTSGIQPPQGVNLKIWEFRITGRAATIQIVFTKTSGGTPVVHNALFNGQQTLASGFTNSIPALIIPLERPIVIPSLQGSEFTQAAWTQNSSFGPTNVEFDVEFEDGMI